LFAHVGAAETNEEREEYDDRTDERHRDYVAAREKLEKPIASRNATPEDGRAANRYELDYKIPRV